jgi:hypothetical protein
MRNRALSALLVIGTLMFAASASAQYRNNALEVTSGWAFMGSLDPINESYASLNAWGVTDQFVIGAGIKSAIGYSAFFESEASLGFGGGINVGAVAKTVVGLYLSAGGRYNFLDEKFRPFVAGHIQYLQFFNTEGTEVRGNAALGGAALWVGLRPVVGAEYFFMEENSLQVDLSPTVYVNLDQAPKFGGQLQVSWNVYF